MKAVIHNDTHIGAAKTWGQVAVALRSRYPGDCKIEKIAASVERGILGELSWRAVETPASFTIASVFGTSGLAVTMMVQ